MPSPAGTTARVIVRPRCPNSPRIGQRFPAGSANGSVRRSAGSVGPSASDGVEVAGGCTARPTMLRALVTRTQHSAA
jgi:hypothetical protein